MIGTPPDRAVPFPLILVCAICLSALVGWLDYHADEVQGTVLVLIVITGALSFAAPARAWIIALIMGLSVAGAYVVGKLIGVRPVYPMPVPLSSLVALIPAAIGAAAGASVRLAIRSRLTH